MKGGEVIELISDLGGGKTTLVRGIARGAGSPAVVGSPTFTISKLYPATKCDIHHFDFYRLNEAGLVAFELHDILVDPHAVVVVEWGDIVHDALPPERLTIQIEKTADGKRKLTCNTPNHLQYLMP
ncbi:MAG TPA: tRNA (adenosine(37)-N6)-threonylcarbamoyltransferase complex ATPase subunit type 1 TsaE [Patescibacteria group bacterium]|nr:tRNA (adenosine(37)-N6)-threonylcarbamoyltransferase complex ATPase subunit type 1 TsaE [Patescibacteria group bacterium]